MPAAASYSLSAGAFPQQEAETLHKHLAARGYPVYLQYGEEYEVRLGNFETREKAEEMAERLKFEEKLVTRLQEEEDLDQYQLAADVAQETADDTSVEGGREVNDSTTREYSDPRAQKIVSLALELFGQPYKYGGTRVGKGIDCSYFCQTIFKELGIPLPRTSGEQFTTGKGAERSSLKVGDLVFFKKTYYPKKRKDGKKRKPVTRINHVGIYIGNGEFIHATINVKRVTISRLDENYFTKRYAGARRVLPEIN